MKKYNIAVVGATGMVGTKFLEVLEEKKLPVENYYLFASAKSAENRAISHFPLSALILSSVNSITT